MESCNIKQNKIVIEHNISKSHPSKYHIPYLLEQTPHPNRRTRCLLQGYMKKLDATYNNIP